MPAKKILPRTFITSERTVKVEPYDWDIIQEVFYDYIDRKKRMSEEAERVLRSLWMGLGETHSYIPVRPIKKPKKA